MNKLENCPVCENSSFDMLLAQPDSLYFKRTFVKCKSCGLVFVNPQPTDEELDELYNEELSGRQRRLFWDRNSKGYKLQEQPWDAPQTAAPLTGENAFHAVQARQDSRLKLIRRLSPPPASLLDIGCREGAFIAGAKQLGYQPGGIELSSTFAQLARESTELEVFSGTVEKYSALGKPPLDIITMWDVIEHLPCPAAMLRQINSSMKNGGLFCLSTVNLANYRYIIYKNKWRGFYEGEEHIIFFSPGNLASLLRKCGFEPAAVLTRSVPPFLLKWLNYLKMGHILEIYATKVRDA